VLRARWLPEQDQLTSTREAFYMDGLIEWMNQDNYIRMQNDKKHKKEVAKIRSGITKQIREEVLKRDNFTCKLCGKSGKDYPPDLHIDHIKPVSRGGTSDKSNLQTLCQKCNIRKSNR
jgi:5-methylcytosine-specific restriction endonuclease McrA